MSGSPPSPCQITASACLLVLCGLPAAGKTTIAIALAAAAAGQSVKTEVVCFDDAHPQGTGSSESAIQAFDPTLWKASRQAAICKVQQLLSAPHTASSTDGASGGQLLVIVDDNMQYRSMRHECFKLARAHQAAYVQIYLPVSLEEALQRNACREGPPRVPDQVICRMHEVLEPPEPAKYDWEAASLSWPCGDASRHDLWHTIQRLWGPPVAAPPSVEAQAAQRRQAQAATQANLLHALDLHCRRAISAAIGQAPPCVDKRQLAVRLNQARAEMLARAGVIANLIKPVAAENLWSCLLVVLHDCSCPWRPSGKAPSQRRGHGA
ncbi:hypothetical protein WJX72_010984 [[Myrmecia] bisecta]|uniref:Uncharacterized protein n=1 Tax=[Myrmecia] bisecta TaxID=41462 RepID=A0AAW1PX82_9CHLO